MITVRTLYERMHANLIASWSAYAAGSSDARVERWDAACVAVFPREPERQVYNNAVLARGLGRIQVSQAIDALEDVYRAADVQRYAVWAHEGEGAGIAELQARRYHVDTRTRAMAMSLDVVPVVGRDHGLELIAGEWPDYLAILTELEAPPGLLIDVDASKFEVLIGVLDGRRVAAALAYDYEGDCGIYNVGTMPHARRRGIGTALTAAHLAGARERGCTTASLQATEMAEGLYAALGFRDLGRFIEYVPAG
jgi:ribosomal protein S18 acetylase RimI-like enzyme